MHVAGKVFLGLGAVMLVVGGIMTVMGGDTISDIEWDVEGESVFEGPGGTYAHSSDDIMIIYVDDTVDCESFTLTYTNTTDGSTGYDWDDDGVEDDSYFMKEDCADDGMSTSSGDDPAGYYSIGSFNGDKGDYTVESSESFYTVPFFTTIGGVVEEAASGIFAIIGGVGLAGCGVCSLLLGGLLALVLKDDKPATVMTNQVQQ
jgi:hypothetical protein